MASGGAGSLMLDRSCIGSAPCASLGMYINVSRIAQRGHQARTLTRQGKSRESDQEYDAHIVFWATWEAGVGRATRVYE